MISNVDLMFSNEQSSLSTKNITFLSKKKKQPKNCDRLEEKKCIGYIQYKGNLKKIYVYKWVKS